MTDPNQTTPSDNGGQDEHERLNEHLERAADEQFQRQMQQAAALLTGGNGKDAIPLLERCFALRPNDVNVLLNLGGAYILAGRHHRAVPVLERASRIAPENPSVWSNLAAAYLGKLVTSNQTGQDQALIAYQRVIDLDAAYPNVHYNMGLIYIDRRDWHAAYDAFTRALEHNPYDQDAQNMRRRVDEIRRQPPNPANN
ncbi:MAG: tetratricopeptide repeat protein [Chloroflexi bacterium]|nr:tetratricopeptide repeat protein [Chloroflexota bacterium]